MRYVIPAIVAFALTALPVAARDQDKPITDQSVSAVDVAATPVNDLNLRKTEIPALLIRAQEAPYSLAGLRSCPQIASAVGEIDAVLGDDIDLPQSASNKLNAGKVAQSVVANFIPFRGIIRELSGANNSDRRVQNAVYAGTARRAFLKGVGMQRGCRYPARPAGTAQLSMRPDPAVAKPADRARGSKRTRYASNPVVQPTR